MTIAPVDAYAFYGPVVGDHPALVAGLDVSTMDLDAVKSNILKNAQVTAPQMLSTPSGALITGLDQALVTWQEDLQLSQGIIS